MGRPYLPTLVWCQGGQCGHYMACDIRVWVGLLGQYHPLPNVRVLCAHFMMRNIMLLIVRTSSTVTWQGHHRASDSFVLKVHVR